MSKGQELIERARALGLELEPAPGGRIRYLGPSSPEVRALLEELREHRAEVLLALQDGGGFVGNRNLQTPLPVSPRCRFTLKETADVDADRQLMAAVAALISQYPGDDPVVMTIVALDGSRQRLLWRAEVTAALRRRLAGLLLERAGRADISDL